MPTDLRTLALGYAADLAPAGTQGGGVSTYDERIVEAVCATAARRTVQRVYARYGAAGLMQPRGEGRPLMAAVTGAEMDALRYDARPLGDAATDRLAGYLVVQTPPQMLQHVRISLAGQRGSCTSLRAAEGGPEAAFRWGYGVRPGAVDAPQPDTLAGYLVTHAFPATDDAEAVFTAAVALTPFTSLEADALAGVPLSDLVAEWVYVRVPEPADLVDDLQDAAAWLAASLLLEGDPETLTMSARATLRYDEAIRDMAPQTSAVTYRLPRPLI